MKSHVIARRALVDDMGVQRFRYRGSISCEISLAEASDCGYCRREPRLTDNARMIRRQDALESHSHNGIALWVGRAESIRDTELDEHTQG